MSTPRASALIAARSVDDSRTTGLAALHGIDSFEEFRKLLEMATDPVMAHFCQARQLKLRLLQELLQSFLHRLEEAAALQAITAYAGRSTLDAGRWMLDVGRSTLDDGRWTLDACLVPP
jgi:hypothetical protein